MDIVGYTDHLSVCPGESLRVMLSSSDPEVKISLVRLIHGDDRGPGFKSEPVPSTLEGTYPAAHQPLRTGSYVTVDDDHRLNPGQAFTVALWFKPTRLAGGGQALVAKRVTTGDGWMLSLTADGRVRFAVSAGGHEDSVSSTRGLAEHRWHFAAAAFDGASGRLDIVVCPLRDWPVPSYSVVSEGDAATGSTSLTQPAPVPTPLVIGGAPERDEHSEFVGRNFNGKIATPRLFSKALSSKELAAERKHNDPPGPRAGIVAAWEFSQHLNSRHVADASGNGLHGRAVQMPTRAVTGPSWDDQATSYHEAPQLYDAIHLHDDDLDDAGWTPTVEWTVDPDLPSGIYAAHITGTRHGEDYLPFIVRPPRNRATARILLVAPLFSWMAYGNMRAVEEYSGNDAPDARYVVAHRLNSLYDRHSDGSGVCYSSWLRPVLNIRPGFRLPILDSTHQLSADLYLVDWLHREGLEFDVVTDADVHRGGSELLRRYQVVLSGTHTEYWSGPMLEALQNYTDNGGRYMYLSGNGLYWVTSLDPEEQHTVEVRRYGASVSAWHAEPGEWYLSTSGERGGTWRQRGRPAQRYVGVGFAGCWGDTPLAMGAPYHCQPGSKDPRASFIFDGVADDEPIGGFPNLILKHGAAGYEVDRADATLGTPPHALVLASATEFPQQHWKTASEDGYFGVLRSDMVFFETPGGGAVFSTGSISWCGALSYNKYDNNVATITSNVLRRFLSPEPFETPAAN